MISLSSAPRSPISLQKVQALQFGRRQDTDAGILTEVFRGFPQSLQGNAGIIL
jgi:hypothetical protein